MIGDVLAALALLLYGFVRHVEYFPPWAQYLIALGWAVFTLQQARGMS